MERRFFNRVDVEANGELLWATKSRVGRISNHREYIKTVNVSMDGAKIAVPGYRSFPVGARARLKLGIEFSEVEVLETIGNTSSDFTLVRVTFVSPNHRFISVVERWMPISTEERDDFMSSWI